MREKITLKNTLILVGTVGVVAAVAAFFMQWLNPPEYTLPPTVVDAPAPSSNIGKTTIEELRARPGLLEEKQLSENSSEFSFDSGLFMYPDVIETTDGIVSYEAVTIVPVEGTVIPRMVDYLAKYGDPGLIVEGSKRQGPFLRTYVYPTLGFAFVGNPATDEIFEFEYFVPMTSSEYTSAYGEGFQTVEQVEPES